MKLYELFFKNKHEEEEHNNEPESMKGQVDQLTGLPNLDAISAFYRGLTFDRQSYGYVLFHINKFRRVNTIFGYGVGSLLLKNVAITISKKLMPEEMAARLANDYFGLLLHFDNEEEFSKRMNEIFDDLKSIEITDGRIKYAYEFLYTGGVSLIENNNESYDEINKKAEAVIHRLGEGKDSQWAYYDELSRKSELRKEHLAGDILRAVTNNQFVPYFQPQYRISTKEIVGAEVLIRWEHPVYGTISPEEFIPILENAGCLPELDMIMIEGVCKELGSWFEQGLLSVPLSINISSLNIQRKDFINRIRALSNKYQVPANMLIIELGERAIHDNVDKVSKLLESLREFGFSLAVDDFGSGYSSLQILHGVPVNMVKLNRLFLRKFGQDEKSRVILTHLIRIVDELGIKMIAEGVEEQEQEEFLTGIGCTMAQGFLYSRPVTKQEFEKMVFYEEEV